MAVVLFGACAPATPPAPDRIVFSSFRPTNWDILLYSAADAPPETIAEHPSLDYDATFSPDGRWLVFTSERNGTPDLFAVDLSSAERTPVLLIDSRAMEDQAAFSPDGSRLAFVGTESGNADVYVIDFDPAAPKTMADARNLTAHPGGDFRPSFSPDGTHLAFSSDRDTPTRAHEIFPFSRQRAGEIYTVEIATAEARRITELEGWDGSPVWTPDGDRLVFYSAGGVWRGPERGGATQQGGFGIWSTSFDGEAPTRLTEEGVEALSPKLTADGRLVFVTREGNGYDATWDIVSVDAAGGDLRSEISGEAGCWGPDVHPEHGLVCHGEGDASPVAQPVAGYESDPLLFPGYPHDYRSDEIQADLYSMNHGFSVPPHPTEDRVLVSGGGEGSELYVSRIDGSQAERIAEAERGALFAMRWSKTGDRVTYTVGPFFGRAAQRSDVWVVNADGTGSTNVTDGSSENDGLSDFLPGGDLVFRSGRGGAFELYRAGADGGSVERLTDDGHKDNFPATSPAGNQIVFVSDRDATPDADGHKTFDLYLMDLDDGGAIRRITTDAGQDSHAQFSPDGEWVIYTSEKGGINDEEPLIQELHFNPQMYGEIFAYRIRDGLSLRLTHNKWEDGGPFWVGPVSSP